MTNSKFNEDYPHTLYIVNYTIAVYVTPALGAAKHSGTGSEVLEKEMATHSSTLAWKIPWIEEPRRLQSIRSQRVGHN